MLRAPPTLLLALSLTVFGCDPSPGDDDAGAFDAEAPLGDASPEDGGADAAPADAEPPDAEPPDAEPPDADLFDGGPLDGGPFDGGPFDGGGGDAGPVDAGDGIADGGTLDGGTSDAGSSDAGASDAGATFYTVTVTTSGGGGGSVTSTPAGLSCPSTCEVLVEEGASVTLAASADGGSTFTGWVGGGCGGVGPADCALVDIRGDVTVDAAFEANPTLRVVFPLAAGSGTVTSVPAGIDCGADCEETVAFGAAVELTATPDADSVFAGWIGGGCSGTDPCALTLTASTTVTPIFGLDTRTLTVLTDGSGSGTVSSEPTGVDCGGDCAEGFPIGTEVTLSAAADTGSTFTGWSGGGCSGTEPCVVTLSAARTVTATFTLQTFTVTVEVVGTGSGRVDSDPMGIECGADCALTLAFGTELRLDAAVFLGSRFLGWSLPECSVSTSCTFTVTEDTTVTATFDDPDTVSCTVEEGFRFCRDGPLPEIDLGVLAEENCRVSCQDEMAAAGMLEGCWLVASDRTCYCRSGEIGGESDSVGGTCR